jgi:hypothetical protein
VSLKGRIFRFLQRLFSVIGVSFVVGSNPTDIRTALNLLTPKASPSPMIRVGGTSDGGYLVPDDFVGVYACFSPGVAESAGFELDLANRGIRSFMADYSVEKSPLENDLFDFEKLFLGTVSDGEVFIRLDDWIEQKANVSQDFILQMDIEGAEWAILADLPVETLKRFRTIVIELHNLDSVLTNPDSLRVFEALMQRLTGLFEPVHLHPNNCCGELNYQGVRIPRVLEVTFLRKDRFEGRTEFHSVQIPNPLDVKNVPNRKDVSLSADWIG